MGNFAKQARNKADFHGSMKFALVRTEEQYKGKTYVKWKGSFQDGNTVFIVDMGELTKEYKVSDKKGHERRAYFGNVAKLTKSGGR